MAEHPTDSAALRPMTRPAGLAPEPLRPQARPATPDVETVAEVRLRPDGLGEVSRKVQDSATVAAALPLDETTLLGLFSGPEGTTALVRTASGRFLRVSEGAALSGGRVVAISPEGLRLDRDGSQTVLTMPG